MLFFWFAIMHADLFDRLAPYDCKKCEVTDHDLEFDRKKSDCIAKGLVAKYSIVGMYLGYLSNIFVWILWLVKSVQYISFLLHM